MANVLPKRWTRQPQQFARVARRFVELGLHSAILPSGNKIYDLIKPSRAITYNGNFRPDTFSNGEGINTNGGYAVLSDFPLVNTFSRVVVIKPYAFSDGTISTGVGTPGGSSQLRLNGSGELNFLASGIVDYGSSSGARLVIGKTSVVGMTFDGFTIRFFSDGRLVGTISATKSFNFTGLFTIGALTNGDEAFQGVIGLNLDFNKVLNAGTMLALTANPWQVFEAAPPLYLAADAVPTISATADQTLQPVTQAAGGTVTATAQATQTLQPTTQVANGVVTDVRSATANQTIQPTTQVAGGSVLSSAQATQTLAPVTQSATGTTPHGAQAAQTLQPTTQIANGTVGDSRNANAAQTLQPVTQVAGGSVRDTLTGNQYLAAIIQQANGGARVGIVGNQSSAPVTQAAGGTVGNSRNGAANQALPPIAQQANGTTPHAATASQVGQSVTQVANGTVVNDNRTLTGLQYLEAIIQQANGTVQPLVTNVTGDQHLAPVTQLARGSVGTNNRIPNDPIIVKIRANDDWIVRI